MTDDPTPAADDAAEVSDADRRALDAWLPALPPAGFSDRVVAARPVVADPTLRRARRRRMAAWSAAAAAAAAAALVAYGALGTHAGTHAAHGELAASAERVTAQVGERAVVVAEPAAALRWTIAADGAADVTQPAGNVFYRVDHGGPLVVHTPAGDVRVTGTCFRVEVEMNKPTQMILAGAAGAAVATGVVITVYEGRVVADTHAARTELQAGTRTVLEPPGHTAVVAATAPAPVPATAPTLDVAHASRDQLVARIAAQDAELVRLRRVPAGEHPGGGLPFVEEPSPDGRPWHDPSPETLKEWAADCLVRYDQPGFDHPAVAGDHGLTADELPEYDAAVSGVQQKFTTLVRTLYLATTNDTAGAETLSLDAMIQEINAKAPPGEDRVDRATLAQERAGMIPKPADTTHEPPLEQLLRAQMALGDQTQAALADRLGADRAAAIRGESFGMRYQKNGCPQPAGK